MDEADGMGAADRAYGCMDGWMGGWADCLVDGWMDGLMDGPQPTTLPTYLPEIPTFYTKSLSNGHGSIMMVTFPTSPHCTAKLYAHAGRTYHWGVPGERGRGVVG